MTAGRAVNSLSHDWCTPAHYVAAVREVFGRQIDLDPCSSPSSRVNARVEYQLPHLDGLKASWDYRTIYVNPPYGADRERRTTIKKWLQRCLTAHEQHGSEVLALVPVATNTGHWKRFVWGAAAAVSFLYDTRLRFLIDGMDHGKGAPMSCAMVYWGSHYQRFFDVFIEYGAVVDIRPLRSASIGGFSRKKQPVLFDGL